MQSRRSYRRHPKCALPFVERATRYDCFFVMCVREGIAAANIELEGTKINACTMHAMFSIGGDAYESKLDFTRSDDKIQELVNSRVLLFDEVSMLDNEIWDAITKLLGLAHQRRTGGVAGQAADEYGSVHLVCFGYFKQLPYHFHV